MRRFAGRSSLIAAMLLPAQPQQTATSTEYGFTAAPPFGWYSKWRWLTVVVPVDPT